MCYYNGQKVTRDEYIRLKDLEKRVADYDFLQTPLVQAPINQRVAVLKPNSAKNDFQITEMEWGFLPTNVADREAVVRFRRGYKLPDGRWKNGYDTMNARSETLLLNEDGKPSMYKYAAMHNRVLVLSTNFFEWQHIFAKNKRTGELRKTPDKYPYTIYLPDEPYFFLAGIYNPWTDKTTGEIVDTVSVITTNANFLMAQVHNSKKRMPTILDKDAAFEWMFGDLREERMMELASSQYPWEKMDAYTIPKDFRELDNPTEHYDWPEDVVPKLQRAA